MKSSSKLKVRSSSNLKHLVTMAGLSSKEMSSIVGITAPYGSSIINGGSNPSPMVADKIAKLLSERLDRKYVINDIFFDLRVKKDATPVN